jgi:hypothetical protein
MPRTPRVFVEGGIDDVDDRLAVRNAKVQTT